VQRNAPTEVEPKNRLLLFVTLGLLTLSGCGKTDSRVVKLFGGEATIAALQTATTVEALRIDPKKYDEDKLTDGTKGIAGYAITDRPVKLSPEQIKSLAAILANPGTYSFDSSKGCKFDPGIALRTLAGQQEVVVLLCFSCDELAIFVQGKRVGSEDTDNARGKLLALARQLFPQDEAIQALK